VVTLATLIEQPTDFDKVPIDFRSSPFGWIFVESSFDPLSKIRRGRLFQKFGNAGWETVLVERHIASSSDQVRANGQETYLRITGLLSKELSVFSECTHLLSRPSRGEGMQIALGQKDAMSTWQIVQVERIITGDVLVTLRAQSALGVLPDIDYSRIHPDNVRSVKSAIERVSHAAYRELPSSVVDHCRNAAVMVISRWMQRELNAPAPTELDLGEWIKRITSHFGPTEMVALRSALEAINRLHPRGKDNEAHKYGLRPLVDEDAEFTLHALAFVLREVKWAR
jgi:hypothetical protein